MSGVKRASAVWPDDFDVPAMEQHPANHHIFRELADLDDDFRQLVLAAKR
jgi:hypothetical protein